MQIWTGQNKHFYCIIYYVSFTFVKKEEKCMSCLAVRQDGPIFLSKIDLKLYNMRYNGNDDDNDENKEITQS